MPYDFDKLPHKGIQTLTPYEAGKSIAALAHELGLDDIVKLASNENPLGCSEKVNIALRQMTGKTISLYPSATNHPLHHHLANHLHISPDQLLLSNGSDALFTLLMITFALHTQKRMLTHAYAFNAYTIQAQTLGIPAVVVPVRADYTVDMDALIAAISPDIALVFIASPNNPTGSAVPQSDIKRLLQHLPSTTLLALDEAYLDYHPEQENTLDWLQDFPNLVLLRTFSKVYGLAGLRLGYAIAHQAIIHLLKRAQLPFVVSQAALDAGLAAYNDPLFVQKSIQLVQQEKPQLAQGLQALNLTVYPSDANFIMVDTHQPARPLYEKLLQCGVIVRPLDPYGLNSYLRITIGTALQNKCLLKALARSL